MMNIYYENQSNLAAGNTEKKVQEERKRRRRALKVIDPNHCGVVSKKPLTKTQSDHYISNPLQRPITRKSAAQIATFHSQALQQPESKRYYEEGKAASGLPVPMSSETSLVELQEIEMEDIFEEHVLDIDGPDAQNPLFVADYVDDIYSYYRRMEANSCVGPQYMSHQSDINEKMRAILIDWLIEVHYKFELREETLYLTVNLIDRFLERQNVERKKLQLVGLIAMLLACKYEEVSVPVVDDLIFISDKAYSRQDLLHMERVMLNTLQFKMSCPTPYVFLRRFLKAAESEKKMELLCMYLMELSLVEYEMIKFPPSLLAAAAVYTAQSSLYGFSQWSTTCQFYTTYSEPQLLECSRLMVTFHQKAASGKLTGVHRKYSTSKLGYAAKSQPALFLLQQDDTH